MTKGNMTLLAVIPQILFFMPVTASATLWGLDLTGHVESVTYSSDFPYGNPISAGDSFSGRISYDLDAVDLWSQPGYDKSAYPNSAFYRMESRDLYYGITVNINELSFRTLPGDVLVWDNEYLNLGGADRLHFISGIAGSPDWSVMDDGFPWELSSGRIDWELQDNSMQAIDRQDLPTDINLANWSLNDFIIHGSYFNYDDLEYGYSININGTVDTVYPAPIPI
ncbi:MAG: hypothetical protein WBO18_17445, partial [Gammaproteobacteria bacterium]